MGAPPTIKILQKKILTPYACDMCKTLTKKSSFTWKSWFTKDEIVICKDCAYKESYGTKRIKKAKKENMLEK